MIHSILPRRLAYDIAVDDHRPATIMEAKEGLSIDVLRCLGHVRLFEGLINLYPLSGGIL